MSWTVYEQFNGSLGGGAGLANMTMSMGGAGNPVVIGDVYVGTFIMQGTTISAITDTINGSWTRLARTTSTVAGITYEHSLWYVFSIFSDPLGHTLFTATIFKGTGTGCGSGLHANPGAGRIAGVDVVGTYGTGSDANPTASISAPAGELLFGGPTWMSFRNPNGPTGNLTTDFGPAYGFDAGGSNILVVNDTCWNVSSPGGTSSGSDPLTGTANWVMIEATFNAILPPVAGTKGRVVVSDSLLYNLALNDRICPK